MARLIVTLGDSRFDARAAQIRNAMRGYVTIDLGPLGDVQASLLAQPIKLTVIDDQDRTWTMHGISRAAHEMLAAHSWAGLLDIVPRNQRYTSPAPSILLPKIVEPYVPKPMIECQVGDVPNKQVEQYDQTDFQFLSQIYSHSLLFDSGVKLSIVPKALQSFAVSQADLPNGPGRWAVQDVASFAFNAAAQGLDPGESFQVTSSAPEIAPHPELIDFLAAANRLRSRLPAAKVFTNARSSESLRARLERIQRRQLADSLQYKFVTNNILIQVGMRLMGLTRGPLVVVATNGEFLDGEFIQEVTAIPEPLAAEWGHDALPAASSLVTACVVEGNDSYGIGRVPIVFAHQPDHVAWARPGTLHAHNSFQCVSTYTPGEEVIVGFLHSNPGDAVILGSVFNSQNLPKTTKEQELVFECEELVVRLNAAGFEVLFADQHFKMSSDGIFFHGKKFTAGTSSHKWEITQ